MRLAFREKPIDLFVVMAGSAVTILLVAAGAAAPARFLPAFAFVLFFPGYGIAAVLFPKDGEIGWIERLALSFGLSIAAVPLLALLLVYSPWGFRVDLVVGTLGIFTIASCAMAYRRRVGLPETDRLALAVNVSIPRWADLERSDKGLAIGLATSFTLIAVSAGLPWGNQPPARFTEFYLLDATGGVKAYPYELTAGEEAVVILGIANRELRAMDYTVQVRLVEVEFVNNGTIERSNVTLDSWPVALLAAEAWEEPYTLQVTNQGDYFVKFLLFVGLPAGTPYRFLSLPIQIT